MKRMLFAVIALLCLPPALAGCATIPPSVPAAPVEVADRVTVDETTAIAVYTGVEAAAELAALAVKAGVIKGRGLDTLADLSRRGRAGITAAEKARLAVNATSWTAAVAELNGITSQLRTLAKGN